MYEDGAAAKDGRLWAGDQILEVRSRYFVLFLLIIFYSRLKDIAFASREVQYMCTLVEKHCATRGNL